MTHDDELREALWHKGIVAEQADSVMEVVHAYVEMRVAEALRNDHDSESAHCCERAQERLDKATAAWRKAIGGE